MQNALWKQHCSPFAFNHYLDYLNAVRATGSKKGGKLSLKGWASRLGYRSHRTLGMVLQARRLPSSEMISRLSEDQKLNDKEHRYFELLVDLQKKQKRRQSIESTLESLSRINPQKKEKEFLIERDLLPYLAHWYHLVIKQLIESPGFKEDPKWIQKRIRVLLREVEIQRSLELLQKLRLVVRDQKGRLSTSAKRTIKPPDVPSAIGRNLIRQMSQLAIEALSLSVDVREFDVNTFRMPTNRISEAKQFIRNFRESFLSTFSEDGAEEVFQLNIQFFPHTKINQSFNEGNKNASAE